MTTRRPVTMMILIAVSFLTAGAPTTRASEPPPPPLPPARPGPETGRLLPPRGGDLQQSAAPVAPGDRAAPDPSSAPDPSAAHSSTAEGLPGGADLYTGLREEAAPERPPTSDASGQAEQVAAATAATRAALAAELSIFVRERPLGAVLSDVAQVAGLRLRVNDRLDDAVVSQQRLEGSVREILDALSRRYNLTWFAERGLLDVSKADTATVKTFQIGRVSDRQIRDAIQRFGLINADFALEVDERNGVARVFAPPRLSSRIESIIVGLRPPTVVEGPIEVIRFGQRERAAN